jgi:hypothetical protein
MEWKNQRELHEKASRTRPGAGMSDEPKPDSGLPRSPHHVLDELKNVLSALGQPSTPVPPPNPVKEDPPRDEKPLFFATEKPSVKPSAPASAPPASDADFWSGNVLGWPTGTEGARKESVPPPPVNPPNPFPLTPPSVNAPMPIQVTPPPVNPPMPLPVTPPSPQNFAPPPPPPTFTAPPPPAFAPPLEPESPPVVTVGSPFRTEPFGAPPEPPVVVAPPPSAPFILDNRPPWPMEESLPEAPIAPESPSKLNLFHHTPSAPPPMSDNVEEPELPSSFPIPQTVSHHEPSAANEVMPPISPSRDPFTPDEAGIKPKNIVQLACMFPEGQDRIGQQFARQLRDLGAQSVPALTVEPVLISSWSFENIDMNAWTRSAQLSGADVLFIISPRQEMSLFQQTAVPGLQADVKTRVIATEHVPLRTLYNDILIELKRKF